MNDKTGFKYYNLPFFSHLFCGTRKPK